MSSTDKRTGTAVRQKSVEEEILSLDSMTASNSNLNNINPNQPIMLSKKAIHQRDADENLFLRFLELDPPTEVPTSTTSSGPVVTANGRRLSAPKVSLGRTPFTMTKKLTRTADRGFGFSIVWTHPPRIEKIEPGLSADINGILPGDYVIFIDKHNVVTMPEADVLNLIRSQGISLTMETFRRSGSSTTSAGVVSTAEMTATTSVPSGRYIASNGLASKSRVTSVASNYTETMPVSSHIRPSTACSSNSTMEAAKKRLHLPQVTFSKESIAPNTDNRQRFLLQLVSREQNFISAVLFGIQRFVEPLNNRNDLISPNDHRTLFQNIDELRRISEDILEQLINDVHEPQLNFTSRVYLSKTTAICAAYKKYCNGIKRADCVLVNKSRQAGSQFVAFITEPPVPRKRPDLTMFIHRPLQHFREILKLMQVLATNCSVDSEEHKNFTAVINELQAAYREITVSSGLMEPIGEGRPLLTLQDLESRMVFTKCKPFTLAIQGRQWIFGGDLSRVEGRSVKPYWTLLFSDIIVFAKVSRDRVLFITEEPIPIANIVDSCFHMRKKTAEFRITVDPNGRFAESPTGYCAPDITRTPKKSERRKSLTLRAPSLELKAVWQNLLQRQIFLVNAALGSTPLSSPLDSPDVLNTSVPLCEIGLATASVASMKLSSMDSIHLKNQQSQQVRSIRTKPEESFENLQKLAGTFVKRSSFTQFSNLPQTMPSQRQKQHNEHHSNELLTSSLRSIALSRRHLCSHEDSTSPLLVNSAGKPGHNSSPAVWLSLSGSSINTTTFCSDQVTSLTAIPEAAGESLETNHKPSRLVEFSISSVGRSFIDESIPLADESSANISVATPDTPTTLNISPSSSKRCPSDAFSNDFVLQDSLNQNQCQQFLHPAAVGSRKIPLAEFGGSWDLLELDLEFHEVNLDTNYDTDVEECLFYGDDDPYGVLPTEPTPPDSLDL